MTGELFLTLLNRSIIAGWLVLVVLVLRLLLKKAPKALFTALWALVAIRLLCPVSFESRFSLIQNAEPIPQELLSSVTNSPENRSQEEIHSSGTADKLPQNPGVPAGDVLGMKEPDVPNRVEEPQKPLSAADGDKAQPEHRKENEEGTGEDGAAGQEKPGLSVLTVVSFIWLAGMAGMLFYGGFSYWRILRKVRESVQLEGNVRICDRIDTSFILGVFRPRIYLPSAANESDVVYVLAHEKAHIKRYDHIWKPLGFLLLSVYWFHPLLWLSYALLCRDIELACDEKVIKALGAESKKPYSAALINCSVPRRMIAACPLAFGEVSVKKRIKSVLNYKKPTFWIMLAALAAFVSVGICFLTNPKKKELPAFEAKSGLELTPDIVAEGIFDDSREKIRLHCETENGEKVIYLNGKKQMTVPEEKKLLLYDMRSEDAFLELIIGEQVTVDESEFWHVTAYRVHQDGLKEISLFPSGEDNSFLIKDWDWLSFRGKFVQLRLTKPETGGIYELTPEGYLVFYKEKQTAITVQGETLLLPEQNVVVYRETGFGIAFESRGFAAGSAYYNIYRTEDGGKSWTLVAEDFKHETAEIEQIYIPDQNTVFCCFGIGGGTAEKSCLMSKDGGATWEYSELQFIYDEKADTDIIDWKDKILEEAMRQATGITDRPITWGDVKDITELDLSGRARGGNGIVDISALAGLTNLTKLDLSYNKITDISALTGLSNLTTLNLADNKPKASSFRKFALSDLEGLNNLVTLDLSSNWITDISTLPTLKNLKELNLSNNLLTSVSGLSLSRFPALTTLDVSGNKLSAGDGLFEPLNLTSLDISRNALVDTAGLSELTKLTTLDLSENKLVNFSNLSDFADLTTLDLSGTDITDVSSLSKCANLTTLKLSGGSITDVSSLSGCTNLTKLVFRGAWNLDISSLSGLTNLEYLDLMYTELADVSGLSGLTNLEYLDLMYTGLADVSGLSGLTNLTKLYLTGNCLADVSGLAGLTNLTELYLSENQLTDVSGLSGLTNLTELYLSKNQLVNISSLSGLTNLTELYLYENQLTDISSLSGLNNLTRLLLNDNRLTDISSLSGLTNLTWLDLSGNKLTDVSSLSGLTNLTRLFLSENRLTDISSLSGLNNLTILLLNDNRLTNVDVLSGLSSLVSLDLRNNRFTDIDSLPKFPNLTTLYVSDDEFVTDGSIQSGVSVTGFTPVNVGGRVSFTGKTAASPSEAEVGDTVRFGNYEQDNDPSNGAEAIEWLVLDKRDGKLLLLSKDALDAKPYNEEWVDVTWETCTLRSWLNGTFYNTAFSPAEQGRIAMTKVKNEDNPPYFWTEGGNDTEDKVFLLSSGEALNYFDPDPDAGDPARRAQATEYEEAQGARTSSAGNTWWWLRSPGSNDIYAAIVLYDGNLNLLGLSVYDGGGGVRPAFWLNLESATATPKPTATPTPKPSSGTAFTPSGTDGRVSFTGKTAASPSEAKVGDTVRFGSYEQDNDSSNGAEVIEWLILDKQDGKLLLLSKDALDAKPYNEEYNPRKSVTWETCTLRNWLNGEFYNTAFSQTEQERILTTQVKNEDNPEYGTEGGNDTEDKVFCLSIGEVLNYFGPDYSAYTPARRAKATAYAEAQGASVYTSGWWWLRSPGLNDHLAADVYNYGYLFMCGDRVDLGCGVVRPAFWLNPEP